MSTLKVLAADLRFPDGALILAETLGADVTAELRDTGRPFVVVLLEAGLQEPAVFSSRHEADFVRIVATLRRDVTPADSDSLEVFVVASPEMRQRVREAAEGRGARP